MEAGQSGSCEGLVETVVGTPLVERCAVFGGEYQAIWIIPQWPRFQLHFYLSGVR